MQYPSEIHLIGHIGCVQMKEDSQVYPNIIKPNNEVDIYIKWLSDWSRQNLPNRIDYYATLRDPPQKILFSTTFAPGSSGSPGFMIKQQKAYVVLIVRAGVPSCFYEDGVHVPANKRVEYGYALEAINAKMRSSTSENIKAPLVCCFGYMWNETVNECIQCLDGFYGEKCSSPCPYPTFGRKCEGDCNCTNESCHHITGCGIYGSTLAATNASGLINKHMKNSDAMNNQLSDIATCTSTDKELNSSVLGGTSVCCAGYVWNDASGKCTPCTLGFYGPDCNDPCPYPSFGKDCQSSCNCSKLNCDHQLGCRKNPQDCDIGYYGYFCEDLCRYPSYGNMCQEHCKCEEDMCHFEKGCKHTLTKSVTTDIGYLTRPSDSSAVLIIFDKSLGNNSVPVLSTTSDQGTNRNYYY
ncbi:multiple epidermal growth factor-like domains protein 10 [Saccostrea cucullata]|uniref:multiple epidermal growth factor-like domains protein 10 n=1 Tax=Saccostrea cuccullata TaxID=36930 RepID=UPI002ED2D145